MAISITQSLEGTPLAKSVRELLEDVGGVSGADHDSARTRAQQARVLARTLGDTVGEVEALYRLALIAFRSGNRDDAFHIALEAREQARRHGVCSVEVRALTVIAMVQYEAGNQAEALESASQALDLHRIGSLTSSEGPLLNTVAMIHQASGDSDRALVTYEAALTANRGFDRPDHDLVTMANMSELRSERNEHLLAVSLGESALELARHHQPDQVSQILTRLATSYSVLGALEQAEACLDEAERTLDQHSPPWAERGPSSSERLRTLCSFSMARGCLERAAGRLDAAVDQYLHALAIAKEQQLIEVEVSAHRELAEIYKQLGRYEMALAHHEERFARQQQLVSQRTETRVRTLRISHDVVAAYHQAEIVRLRTTERPEAAPTDELVESDDLESYQLEAFQRLAVIAEFRDTDTGEHTIRVGDLSAELAAELGESAEFVHRLRLAGRLHDIGKVAVPDSILLKPGPLTTEEFEVMKTHTTVGAEILSGSASPLLQLAAEVALNHHERWDGTGYPHGLSSESIPASGRIVTVADVYDALTSERVYKRAWTQVEAVRYVVAGKGAQFEPRIVDAFVQIMVRRVPELAEDLSAAAE
jgi:putative two-component system response regulator